MYYIDKIKQHMLNWTNYLIEHLIIIIFISVLILLICFIFIKFSSQVNIYENSVLVDQKIIILGITVDNWSIFLAIIGVVGAAIWALYEFDKSVAKRQQEKAAEISNIFSEYLLRDCHILGNVITETELCSKLKLLHLKYTTFKDFDRNELMRLYDNDNIIYEIKHFLISPEVQQIYLRILESQISLYSYQELKEKVYSQTDAEEVFILDNANLPFKFSELVYSVLNQLEAICMNISSQAAGSKYVYQSLHQMFLKIVKLLAPIIASSNKKFSDKHYTNIIHVYNEWTKIREYELRKEQKRIDKINRILNPKIKTV